MSAVKGADWAQQDVFLGPPASAVPSSSGGYRYGTKTTAAEDEAATCFGSTPAQLKILLAVLTAIVTLMAVGFAIAAPFVTANILANQRYYIKNDPSSPPLLGMLQADSVSRLFAWNLILSNASTPIALGVYGPIQNIVPLDAPLYWSLCGLPSTQVCDTSVPGYLNGTSAVQLPGNVISTMRDFPSLYYLLLTPAVGPPIWAPLGISAGNGN
jgi:hypothetical protein